MFKVLEKNINKWQIYFSSILKWIIVAVLTGVCCGILGSFFNIGVKYVTNLRLSHTYIIYFLPLIGIIIGGIYYLNGTAGQNTNDIIEQVQNGEGLSPALIPSIFFATILTHLGGGSAGREGAALQMGGTIGFSIGKWLRLDDRDLRTITITGMAALFSAIFGTPVAASIFAMGVITVGVLYHVALLPCLASSIIAYEISIIMGVKPQKYDIVAPEFEVVMLIKVAILAAMCAGVAILFCKSLRLTGKLAADKIPNEWIRVIVGGIIIIILSAIFSSGDYNGVGGDIITKALEGGEAVPYAFLIKILFTSITLAVGFKGGEIVPCFFIGATFGCTVGSLIGIPPGFAAAVGMICIFCACTNTPLASIFLSIELFGSQGILFFSIACAFVYVLSGYNGLYSSQKILYSKLKAQYINVHTNAHHEGEDL